MKEFQIRALRNKNAIEWIPFNKLSDVKKIGEGGFGSIYKATWLDSIQKVDCSNNNYVRTHKLIVLLYSRY